MPAPAAAAAAGKGAWIAPAAQAGVGIFGNLFAARQNKKAWQRSVSHEQSVWERETAYNHPTQQMQRMREAGLNPMLMYGQGSPGNASPGKAMQSEPFTNFQDISATTMMALQAMSMKADVDLKEANADYTRSKIDTEGLNQQKIKQGIDQLALQFPELLQRLERENRIGNRTEQFDIQKSQHELTLMVQQMEINLRREGLLDLDGYIKTEVLKTKQAQNALLELQRKFMQDGDISQGQFIRILALLLMGKSSF